MSSPQVDVTMTTNISAVLHAEELLSEFNAGSGEIGRLLACDYDEFTPGELIAALVLFGAVAVAEGAARGGDDVGALRRALRSVVFRTVLEGSDSDA